MIPCPRSGCEKLPGFLSVAKLTSHLVDYHMIIAEAAQAEARLALDGPRPRRTPEAPGIGHPRRVAKVAPTPPLKPCGYCHRVDGDHAPSCRRKHQTVGAGAGRHCRRCGEKGHRSDRCPAAQALAGGARRVVRLASGGTVTFEATLDIFTLNAADRRFVFELVDALDRYQRKDKEKR